MGLPQVGTPISHFAKEIATAELEGLNKLARLLDRYDSESEDDFGVVIESVLRSRFNQNELAAEFKVSPGTISRWRAGKSCPPAMVREVIVARVRDMLLETATRIKANVLHEVNGS